MKKMRKPVAGEKLFLVSSYRDSHLTSEEMVSRVGRKYFYIESIPAFKKRFLISDWSQVVDFGTETLFLYESEQAYLDKLEYDELKIQLLRYLNDHGWSFSLDQIKGALEALDLPTSLFVGNFGHACHDD